MTAAAKQPNREPLVITGPRPPVGGLTGPGWEVRPRPQGPGPRGLANAPSIRGKRSRSRGGDGAPREAAGRARRRTRPGTRESTRAPHSKDPRKPQFLGHRSSGERPRQDDYRFADLREAEDAAPEVCGPRRVANVPRRRPGRSGRRSAAGQVLSQGSANRPQALKWTDFPNEEETRNNE